MQYWHSMAYLDDKKKIETIGLDHGVDPIVVYRKGKYELWKIPGRTHHLPGYINPEYFPTEYNIVEVKEDEKPRRVKYLGARHFSWDGQLITHQYTVIVDDIKPGHKWRPAVDTLKAEVIRLANGGEMRYNFTI